MYRIAPDAIYLLNSTIGSNSSNIINGTITPIVTAVTHDGTRPDLGFSWTVFRRNCNSICQRSLFGHASAWSILSLNFFITVEKLSFEFSLDCTQLKFCVSRAFCGSYGGEKTKGNNNAASPFQFSLLLFLFFICMWLAPYLRLAHWPILCSYNATHSSDRASTNQSALLFSSICLYFFIAICVVVFFVLTDCVLHAQPYPPPVPPQTPPPEVDRRSETNNLL